MNFIRNYKNIKTKTKENKGNYDDKSTEPNFSLVFCKS